MTKVTTLKTQCCPVEFSACRAPMKEKIITKEAQYSRCMANVRTEEAKAATS